MYKEICGQCALPSLNGGVCPIFKETMKPEANGCRYFKNEINVCEVCGQPIITKVIMDITEDEKIHYLCESCLNKTGTCIACKMREECEFETNPSTIPKVVQQRIQQGPMTSIIQAKNPTRIDMFCKSCKCFDEEFGCLKENGCCGRWEACYAMDNTGIREV